MLFWSLKTIIVFILLNQTDAICKLGRNTDTHMMHYMHAHTHPHKHTHTHISTHQKQINDIECCCKT